MNNWSVREGQTGREERTKGRKEGGREGWREGGRERGEGEHKIGEKT